MKILIELPDDIHAYIISLAMKDGRKTKPYIERVVVSHAEKKLKIQKSKSITQ